MIQAKLYPAGQLSSHPPLRTLDEAMRERIMKFCRDVTTHSCKACTAEAEALLALLKD